MPDITTLMMAAAGAGGEEADPDFANTVLLLHGDGTNGAQNNTFLDSSTNNFTITRAGNTTQGSFSPFSKPDGAFGNFFDGSGDNLTSSHPALSADWTIEAWIYRTSGSANQAIVHLNSGSFGGVVVYLDGSNYLICTDGVNAQSAFSNLTVPINAWTHIAVVRSGGTTTGYVNGVLAGSHSFTPLSVNAASIGAYAASLYFPGWLSNVRVVNGTAVYTSAFTPSTTPLTAIANTSLLTCQSNRFVDNSTNNLAITRNGDVKVTPFSPFPITTEYSPSVNGGSGYFDGSDYLEMSDNASFQFGANNWTVEFWAYATSSLTTNYIISQFSGSSKGILFGAGAAVSGKMSIIVSSTGTDNFGATDSDAFPLNQWVHVAGVRTSDTIAIFINGVRKGTYTTSAGLSLFNSANLIRIGAHSDGSPSVYWPGYISDLRSVVGANSPYDATQTTITVPTAPPIAITDTQFLCNFTNAGIFDNTGFNNLETVGDAQIDTSVKKYGTGSIEFDGTGDWLLMPHSPDQQLGTGNFTIEFWVYLATGDTGSNRGLVAKGTSTTGFLVSLNTTEKVVFTFATSTITSSGAITTNAWNHIAVVREGTGSNQTKIYIAGTNDGTGTVSTNFNQTSVMYVGANRTAGDPMKGFIDDLRITKGIARYTAAFTPPTKAFPNIGA